MKTIGIYYGSTTGNTKDISLRISKILAKMGYTIELKDINSISSTNFKDKDLLILGASTWGNGELQDDWDTFINKHFDPEDAKEKTVAFIGTGDQYSYPDTFVDSIGILYKLFTDAGSNTVGFTNCDEYKFNTSAALIYGAFVGLPIDEDNEPEKSDERISDWIDAVLAEAGI